MNEAYVAALGVVLSALISGVFGYLIKRSADAAVQNTSRDQIEAAAFERAETIYNNALDRAQSENKSLVEQVANLRDKVAQLETELDSERKERRAAIVAAREEITGVRLTLHEKELVIEQLRRLIARRQAQVAERDDVPDPPDDS